MATAGPSGSTQGISIMQLNDDCLRNIFSYLNVLDLVRMEKVCKRFLALAKPFYQTFDELDYDELSRTSFISLTEARDVAKHVGKHITSLIASLTCFRTASELLPRSVLMHCKNLKEVELSNFKILNQPSLKRLTATIKSAKVVRLQGCKFTDEIKSSLVEAKELEELELTGNQDITGKCLIGIRKIKKINLRGSDFVQPDFFIRFCRANKKLLSVNIIGQRYFDAYTLDEMVKVLKDLESLSISDQYDEHDEPFEFENLAQLPKLTKLHVRYEGRSEEEDNLRELYPLMHHRLESLTIDNNSRFNGADNLFEDTLKEFGRFTKLKTLELFDVANCTDDTLATLLCSETLEELAVYRCVNITPQGLTEVIKSCKKLKFINMCKCPQYGGDFLVGLEPHLTGRSHPLQLVVDNTPIHKYINSKGPQHDFINTFVKNNRGKILISYSPKKISDELWFMQALCSK